MLLVHGAASGPWVFDRWFPRFSGARTEAVDLHGGLDVGRASMYDYADRVAWAAETLPRPLAVCGWSMGGLVAMMAAPRIDPACLILLEPSPPLEVQGPHLEVKLAHRTRGISVPDLYGPALVVYGNGFADERGRRLAETFGGLVLVATISSGGGPPDVARVLCGPGGVTVEDAQVRPQSDGVHLSMGSPPSRRWPGPPSAGSSWGTPS